MEHKEVIDAIKKVIELEYDSIGADKVTMAYKRVNSRAENDNKMNRIILKTLEDVRKHKDWI